MRLHSRRWVSKAGWSEAASPHLARRVNRIVVKIPIFLGWKDTSRMVRHSENAARPIPVDKYPSQTNSFQALSREVVAWLVKIAFFSGGENLKQNFMLFLVCCFTGCVICTAQDGGRNALAERASQEFQAKNFGAAERDFRELTKVDPSNLYAHAYLGHSLFRQDKFGEAIGPYEKASELERLGKKLSESEHRILVDQLVMSYGIDGQLKRAHTRLDEVIQQDPEYPLNYYNLACAFAEEGDEPRALANLQLAFDRKGNILKGEQMPDPRADSSFQKYVRDPDFVSLMRKHGYNRA